MQEWELKYEGSTIIVIAKNIKELQQSDAISKETSKTLEEAGVFIERIRGII